MDKTMENNTVNTNNREQIRSLKEVFYEMGPENSPTYTEFKEKVSKLDKAFRTAQEIDGKEALPDKIWKAFYAIYVVPLRSRLFPNIQSKIEKRRVQNGKNTKHVR